MNPHLYATFLLASLVLMLIPGPNVALIVANSLARGVGCGLVTVAGTSSAMVLQLGLAALGLTAALAAAGQGFAWLRWLGVAYLIVLGIKAWLAPPDDLDRISSDPARLRSVFARGFLVSLTNPKTLLFYGAFFPQFIDSRHGFGGQLAILSASFLATAITVDSLWAVLAARVRPALRRHGRLRSRLTGTLLIGAGVGLAATRQS